MRRFLCVVCLLAPVCARAAPTVQWTFHCDSEIYSSPVVAEIAPGEPGLEILIASSAERKLYCLSASGKALWEFGGFSLRLTSTLTVADDAREGYPVIFVATRSDGVLCLNNKGQYRLNMPVERGIPWGNVSVSSMNPERSLQFYWVSAAGVIECHTSNGKPKWQYPTNEEGSRGPLAIGDIAGDGRIGVVAGGGLHSVFCLDNEGKLCWRFEGTSSFNAGPVLADLDGDGVCEVLAASNDGVLYCLDGRSGKVLWDHRTFTTRIDTTIAVADVDRDGHLEVFYGDGGGRFYCLSSRGEERWSFDAGDWIESSPAIGDVDGDGKIDVLVDSANGNVNCLSSQGKLEWTFPVGARISASPTLCDCNLDGTTDILVAAHNGTLYCLSAGGKWDPKNAPWPCKRRDLAQTACVVAK